MYFITYEYDDAERVGALNNGMVVPAEKIIRENPPSNMMELIKRLQDKEYIDAFNEACNASEGISIDSVKLRAPIVHPARNVICVGKNYRDHIKEVAKAIDDKNDIPSYPIYFSKMVDRILGSGENIPSHSDISVKLDYEAELAVIIGKEGRDIPKDRVEEYIFGYTVLNDISVRDIQKMHIQWFRGKSLDGGCAMGPYIVHKSLISYPPKLNIKCSVNGEIRQNSNTCRFIFDIAALISDFSRGITLRPGDIIATGTPSGVGMGFSPERYLKHGDVVECTIENIGTLQNTVD